MRDRLEVRPARLDEVAEDAHPVVPSVPSDPVGRIDLDRHDLAHFTALDEDDSRSDASALPAALRRSATACGVGMSSRLTLSVRRGDTGYGPMGPNSYMWCVINIFVLDV